jgi:biopolymer transport protein TolQ
MSGELSLIHLIGNATLLVQVVLVVLLLVSVLLWAVIVERGLVYRLVRQRDLAFEEEFWSGIELRDLFNEIEEQEDRHGLESIFHAGFAEYMRLQGRAEQETSTVTEAVQRTMRVRYVEEEKRLERYLGMMATIGSIAPYVGLLGTVWGIMNAFLQLSETQQSTLSAVAPGIAEALIATSMGLFAAIPAVVAYNYYNDEAEAIVSRHRNFIDEFLALLYRNTSKNNMLR